MESKENCGVCGQPLVYGTEEVPRRGSFCGNEFGALIYCPEGHYVGDSCHSRGALDVLRDVLGKTTGTDPVEILEKVMAHPSVPVHGPERHAMVPAIIVAAAKNAGYPVPEGAVEKALEAAVEFLKTRMDINLNINAETGCRYVRRNRECIRDACAYYTNNDI